MEVNKMRNNTHNELLARGGSYAELYEVQSRYYREEESDHEEE